MPPKILLASRLPEEADATAEAAARLAEQVGGRLMLVYVAEELTTVPRLHATTGTDPDALRRQMIEEIDNRARAYLERHLPARDAGIWLVEGDVVEQVTRIAREEGVDYLVIGTERRSTLMQVVLGSTSQKILQGAPCPVLVVPTKRGGGA